MTKLAPEIRSYYGVRPEESRLERGLCQLEAVRTRDLIQRHAPVAPAVIIDIGGAQLAPMRCGSPAAITRCTFSIRCHVSLRKLPDVAAHRSLRWRLVTLVTPDGCPSPQGSQTWVLLLGPLYHLTERDDRIRALLEARRVLKPGGILPAAATTRWAAALDQLVYETVSDVEFTDHVMASLADGQYRSPLREPSKFTTAYFHRPDELVQELHDAGYTNDRVFGIEGPARMIRDFDAWWADPVRREHLVRLAKAFETEPWLLGMNPHLLVFANTPGS